jgi:glucose-1-phosphate thymidylyltransferase
MRKRRTKAMTIPNSNEQLQREVIGLLPAGGQATRISPLPCSKEVYPIGFRSVDHSHGLRPKVVCHYLLEKMQLAGITKAYIVLRQGKWDIPAYLGDGTMLDMHLAYFIMRLPFGAPYTLDQAYPFVKDAVIALGFPDIIFQPDDAFVRLLAKQRSTNADIVLGLFPTDQPQTADMVDFDEDGKVNQIVIKPQYTRLKYAWVIAVWTSVFTHFMHEYLTNTLLEGQNGTELKIQGAREVFIGDVIQAGMNNGLRVESELFLDASYIDIGTPESLAKAVHNFSKGV